jgi:hypothetical protein
MRIKSTSFRYNYPRNASSKTTTATPNIISPCPFPQASLPGNPPLTISTNHTNQPTRDLKYSNDLFNYTRGRFLTNEKHELSQRHIHFNVNELARRAAHAIGTDSCICVEKYPDGMYDKSMLLTMSNGAEVVAKVPNPNAGRPWFTTASEVATMDFVGFFVGCVVGRY